MSDQDGILRWSTQQVPRYSSEMHERNILGARVDYRHLARIFSPLRDFVDKNPKIRSPIDFRDPLAQRCLT